MSSWIQLDVHDYLRDDTESDVPVLFIVLNPPTSEYKVLYSEIIPHKALISKLCWFIKHPLIRDKPQAKPISLS